MFRRITSLFETKEHPCGTQDLSGTSCLAAARESEEEAAHSEPSEMVAPKDVDFRCQQIVDCDEQNGSEEHAGEYDVGAIGLSSAGVATSTFDDRKPEVHQTSVVDGSAVARVCESSNSCNHALSWSSPTDGMPHDEGGDCGDAQDQSPPDPFRAHTCTVSLSDDIPVAFDGLSVQEKKACRFEKRTNSSSVGLGAGSLSDTMMRQGREQQRGGATGISHAFEPMRSAGFWQGEGGDGERLSTIEKPGSQLQPELGNTTPNSKQSPQSLGRCGSVEVETSTASQGAVPTLGSVVPLQGERCATLETAAVGNVGSEKGVKGKRNPREEFSRAEGAPSPAKSPEVSALQPQRLEQGASVDRSAKTVVKNSKSGPGPRAHASSKLRGEGEHSMNRPASPGERTRVCRGDARSGVLPKAAILAPIAIHTTTGRPRLVGRQSNESCDSYGHDQEQDAARPRSDQGHETSIKPDDGSEGLYSVENYSKASHASPRGNWSASSTGHHELQRFSRTREGSSDPESEGRHSVGAGVEDAGLDAISSDDEHYNPSVSSKVLRKGQ